jgi:uncharacterized protein
MSNVSGLREINPTQYINEQYGLPTVRDILQELEKPGRDPRPAFKTPLFQEGVEELSHLKVGMVLEGVVSNVTNFGAFVDIGVHQDGLVHISALTDRFVKDPHDIVKAGDIIQVKVTDVDVARRRISLSMRTTEKPEVCVKEMPVKAISDVPHKKPSQPKHRQQEMKKQKAPNQGQATQKKVTPFNTAMADALSKLKRAHS